jgi:hypothetical protein
MKATDRRGVEVNDGTTRVVGAGGSGSGYQVASLAAIVVGSQAAHDGATGERRGDFDRGVEHGTMFEKRMFAGR